MNEICRFCGKPWHPMGACEKTIRWDGNVRDFVVSDEPIEQPVPTPAQDAAFVSRFQATARAQRQGRSHA